MADRQLQNTYPFTTAAGAGGPHGSGHEHDHEHPHDHPHAPAPSAEDDPQMAYWEQRTKALAQLLVDRGVLTADEVRGWIERIEQTTPMLGARVVARAWTDPAFKARLLKDGKAACEELGIDVSLINHLTVFENTERVHHVVTCTLCSCYPRPLLGEPPFWYKSTAYRNRVVVTPRKVLAEYFGTRVPEHVDLRVIDSTADSRYLILPRRPAGTEGCSEDELIKLITRDSMVGVSSALSPAEATR